MSAKRPRRFADGTVSEDYVRDRMVEAGWLYPEEGFYAGKLLTRALSLLNFWRRAMLTQAEDAALEDTRDRLQELADALDGPHETLPLNELLERIENAAHKQRIKWQGIRAQLDGAIQAISKDLDTQRPQNMGNKSKGWVWEHGLVSGLKTVAITMARFDGESAEPIAVTLANMKPATSDQPIDPTGSKNGREA